MNFFGIAYELLHSPNGGTTRWRLHQLLICLARNSGSRRSPIACLRSKRLELATEFETLYFASGSARQRLRTRAKIMDALILWQFTSEVLQLPNHPPTRVTNVLSF